MVFGLFACSGRRRGGLLISGPGVAEFEPGKQGLGRADGCPAPGLEARDAGKKALPPDVLADLVDRYRDIATSGLAANVYRQTAKDAHGS